MNLKRKGTLEVLIVVAVLLSVSVALITTFPAVRFHYAGSDTGHYANAAAHYHYGHQSSDIFHPPELTEAETDAIDPALVEARDSKNIGLMTHFVSVDASHRIQYPHAKLFPRLAALLWPLADHLDYLFLFSSALLGYLILRRFGLEPPASLAGAGLMLLLPSHLALARFPMSEPLTVFLFLLTIYLSFGRSQWALLPLALLVHARPEFIPVALVLLFQLGFRHPNFWPVSLVLTLSLYAIPFVEEANLSTAVAEMDEHLLEGLDEWLGRPWGFNRLARLAPLFFAAGLAASRVRALDLQAQRLGRWAAGNRVLVAACVGFLVVLTIAADFLRTSLEPGEVLLVIGYQRYLTTSLLLRSAGPLLVGIVGLALLSSDRLRKLPPFLAPSLLLLVVLLDMHATPTNELWWTRRFHIIVYPLLIFGVALLIDWAVKRWHVVAVPLILFALLFPIADRYPEPRDGYMSSETIGAFHDAANELPSGSVVLLAADGWGSKKAQLPLRTYHGLWSYVLWDKARLDAVVSTFARLDRPLLVDSQLVDGEAQFVLPVYETTQTGRAIGLTAVK